MKIVVTGGSGFIGTNLVGHFIGRGDTVLSLDILPPRNPSHAEFWKPVDILDAGGLRREIGTFAPDVVVHMGARTDLDGRSLDDYSANTAGVENLIAAVKGSKILKRIIFASSRLVCGIGYQPKNDIDYCPTTLYGESKIAGEMIVREASGRIPCPWVIVRPTSIWGPWFDVPYKTFFLQVAAGRYMHPGSGSILKSFGFVGNTVYEIQRLLDAPAELIHGRTLYLADYPSIDVAVMASVIQRESGAAPIRTVPVGLLRPAARLGDFLKLLGRRNPPLTTFRLNNLLTPMVHDLTYLQSVAGELPYSMEEGVRITVSWLKARGEIS